jgi:hypothetical protein
MGDTDETLREILTVMQSTARGTWVAAIAAAVSLPISVLALVVALAN